MASNYTEHYQLPIWDPEDSFLREEFNETHQKIDDALVKTPLVATGSYVGTGSYGADAPSSLTFDFAPKVVLISPSATTDNGKLYFPMTAMRGSAQACSNWNTYSYRGDFCVLNWDGATLTWYTNGQYGGAASQYNAANQTYHYFALG